MPKGVSIRAKLLLGFLSVFAIVVVTSAFSVINISRFNMLFQELISKDNVRLQALLELKNVSSELEARLIFLSRPEILATLENFRKWQEVYKSTVSIADNDRISLLEYFKHAEKSMTVLSLDIIDLRELRTQNELILAKNEVLSQVSAQLKKVIEDAVFKESQKLSLLEAETKRSGNLVVNIVIAAPLILFLFLLGLFFLLSRIIVRAITELRDTALKIAGGDLSRRAPVRSKDEIGQLATSFNQMTESLIGSLNKEKAATQQLKASSQQLDANNQQLKASQQQLNAKNQQLDVTNQQLKASEEQAQSKVVELEKFNKVAVDRELKMIELKGELAELKKQLGKA